jgi:hypothetical protein
MVAVIVAPDAALSDRFAGERRVSAHLDGGLVLAFSQINDMPEQTVRRPLGVADLDDHLRAPNAPATAPAVSRNDHRAAAERREASW